MYFGLLQSDCQVFKPDNVEGLVKDVFSRLKVSGAPLIYRDTEDAGDAISYWPVGFGLPDLEGFVKKATAWRAVSSKFFFSQFEPDENRTWEWIARIVEDRPLQLLFILEKPMRGYFGHIGFDFISTGNIFEVGSILKGEDGGKGCMTLALTFLCKWVFQTFPVPAIFLRSFADNKPAILLYERCGFKQVRRLTYFPFDENGDITWKEEGSVCGTKRFNLEAREIIEMAKGR